MKSISKIEVPEEWQSINDYDSHRGLLYLACQNTTGCIAEAGMGFGSTRLLDGLTKKGRVVGHYDNSKDWIIKMNKEAMSSTYVFDWLENGLFPEDIGLLFVDCAPGEIRKHLIEKYSDIAKVIVVHDSELGADYVYHLSGVLSKFKYRLNYEPEGKPHTTAVSNFIDVEKWVE